MLKKIRERTSQTVVRTKPAVTAAADKAKGVAGTVAHVAKTARHATGTGAKVAVDKAGSGLKTAGGVAAHGARHAVGGVKNVSQSAAMGAVIVGGAAAGTAKALGTKAWDKVDDKVELYWTVIQQTFIETVIETTGGALQSAVKNDETMKRIFQAVYIAVPSDLRRWISEEQFVGFLFKNRDRLLGAATDAATKTAPPALPEQNDTRMVDV